MTEHRVLYRIVSGDTFSLVGALLGTIIRDIDVGPSREFHLFDQRSRNFYSVMARRIGPAPTARKPELIRAHVERLIREDDLRLARRSLRTLYPASDVSKWLQSPHQQLRHSRAIDLMGTERAHEVFALIDQLRSGAHV